MIPASSGCYNQPCDRLVEISKLYPRELSNSLPGTLATSIRKGNAYLFREYERSASPLTQTPSVCEKADARFSTPFVTTRSPWEAMDAEKVSHQFTSRSDKGAFLSHPLCPSPVCFKSAKTPCGGVMST